MSRIRRALRAQRLLEFLGYRGDAVSALEELDRRRRIVVEYRRWLAEFPHIGTALDNMEAEVACKQLSVSYPPSPVGPWAISRLRDVLRAQCRPELNPDSIMQLVSACLEEAWRMGRRGLHHWQGSFGNRELNDRLKAVRAALDVVASSAADPTRAGPSDGGVESGTVRADLIPSALCDAKCVGCGKVWKVSAGVSPPPCIVCGARVRFSLSAVKT